MSRDWTGSAKLALKEGLSDMDYLRSKVVKKPDVVDEKEEEGDKDKAEEEVQQMDSAYESGDKDSQKATPPFSSSKNKVCSNSYETFLNLILCQMSDFHFYTVLPSQFEPATEFTVKLRGVPFTVKEVMFKSYSSTISLVDC